MFIKLCGKKEAIFQFSVSTNTLDQAEKVIEKAEEEGLEWIGFMDYEFHATRTVLTLIRQARKRGLVIKFVPYVYVDNNRRKMLPVLRELGILVEAMKLYRYQRKGDSASLQEAMDYYEV